MKARVGRTYLYPIKACAPLQVSSLSFDSSGDLRGDRQWVVVDAEDRITWQGAIPTLARILPTGTSDRLAITSATGAFAELPTPGQGAPRTIQSWNAARQAFDVLAGHDAGDAVADFASTITGQKIRLVHLDTRTHRPNPVHIITDASLGSIASPLDPQPDLRRFRPNIVLSADGAELPPFIEERATSLVYTTAKARLVLAITAPCERCIVINVDPATSATDVRYLKSIAAHSQNRRFSAPAVFGVYARATTVGTLAAGDKVDLIIPKAD